MFFGCIPTLTDQLKSLPSLFIIGILDGKIIVGKWTEKMYILLIYSDGMQINITLGHINEVDRVAFNFFPAGNLSSQHSCKDVLFRHAAPQNLKLDLLLHFPDEHSQYCVSLLLSCPGELFRDQGDKPSLEGGQVLPDLLLLSLIHI